MYNNSEGCGGLGGVVLMVLDTRPQKWLVFKISNLFTMVTLEEGSNSILPCNAFTFESVESTTSLSCQFDALDEKLHLMGRQLVHFC